jgi:hypothetical protein
MNIFSKLCANRNFRVSTMFTLIGTIVISIVFNVFKIDDTKIENLLLFIELPLIVINVIFYLFFYKKENK